MTNSKFVGYLEGIFEAETKNQIQGEYASAVFGMPKIKTFLVMILLFTVNGLSQSGDKYTLALNDLPPRDVRLPQCSHVSVKGTVFVRSGGVAIKTPITFKSESVKIQSETNNKGIFEAELPEGLFQVEIGNRTGPIFKRASFRVSCDGEILLNFYVYLDSISDGMPDVQKPRINYFSPPDGEWFDNRFIPVVAFTEKTMSEHEVSYKNAVFTLNKFSISGDEIIVDWKSNTIAANGDVWFDDGRSHTDYLNLEVKFTSFMTRIKGVRSLFTN